MTRHEIRQTNEYLMLFEAILRVSLPLFRDLVNNPNINYDHNECAAEAVEGAYQLVRQLDKYTILLTRELVDESPNNGGQYGPSRDLQQQGI